MPDDVSPPEAGIILQERVLSEVHTAIPCAQCQAAFTPRRLTQAFCCDRCRKAHHTDRGIEGSVVGVRRTKGGASITVRLAGPAAEAALRLGIGQRVRVVPSSERR